MRPWAGGGQVGPQSNNPSGPGPAAVTVPGDFWVTRWARPHVREGTWGSVYPAIPGTCFATGQSLCTYWHAAILRAQPFSAWPEWWGQSSSFAAWCRDHPLAVGSATGDSAPTVLHTLQPTLTCAWLFIAGTDVDLDQVEDNKVIFRFISQLVKGNRLCWLRQALSSLSGHSQVLGRVTPMVGLEKGHSLDTMRAQRMQKRPQCPGLHRATLPATFIQGAAAQGPHSSRSQKTQTSPCLCSSSPSIPPDRTARCPKGSCPSQHGHPLTAGITLHYSTLALHILLGRTFQTKSLAPSNCQNSSFNYRVLTLG